MNVNRKRLYEKNNFSKRLKWVREQLNVSAATVAELVPMPACSLFLLENKSRTAFYEQIMRLAVIYNELWSIEFKSRFPKYNDRTVEEITFTFLCFGHDAYSDYYKEQIKRLKAKHEKHIEEIKGAWHGK